MPRLTTWRVSLTLLVTSTTSLSLPLPTTELPLQHHTVPTGTTCGGWTLQPKLPNTTSHISLHPDEDGCGATLTIHPGAPPGQTVQLCNGIECEPLTLYPIVAITIELSDAATPKPPDALQVAYDVGERPTATVVCWGEETISSPPNHHQDKPGGGGRKLVRLAPVEGLRFRWTLQKPGFTPPLVLPPSDPAAAAVFTLSDALHNPTQSSTLLSRWINHDNAKGATPLTAAPPEASGSVSLEAVAGGRVQLCAQLPPTGPTACVGLQSLELLALQPAGPLHLSPGARVTFKVLRRALTDRGVFEWVNEATTAGRYVFLSSNSRVLVPATSGIVHVSGEGVHKHHVDAALLVLDTAAIGVSGVENVVRRADAGECATHPHLCARGLLLCEVAVTPPYTFSLWMTRTPEHTRGPVATPVYSPVDAPSWIVRDGTQGVRGALGSFDSSVCLHRTATSGWDGRPSNDSATLVRTAAGGCGAKPPGLFQLLAGEWYALELHVLGLCGAVLANVDNMRPTLNVTVPGAAAELHGDSSGVSFALRIGSASAPVPDFAHTLTPVLRYGDVTLALPSAPASTPQYGRIVASLDAVSSMLPGELAWRPENALVLTVDIVVTETLAWLAPTPAALVGVPSLLPLRFRAVHNACHVLTLHLARTIGSVTTEQLCRSPKDCHHTTTLTCCPGECPSPSAWLTRPGAVVIQAAQEGHPANTASVEVHTVLVHSLHVNDTNVFLPPGKLRVFTVTGQDAHGRTLDYCGAGEGAGLAVELRAANLAAPGRSSTTSILELEGRTPHALQLVWASGCGLHTCGSTTRREDLLQLLVAANVPSSACGTAVVDARVDQGFDSAALLFSGWGLHTSVFLTTFSDLTLAYPGWRAGVAVGGDTPIVLYGGAQDASPASRVTMTVCWEGDGACSTTTTVQTGKPLLANSVASLSLESVQPGWITATPEQPHPLPVYTLRLNCTSPGAAAFTVETRIAGDDTITPATRALVDLYCTAPARSLLLVTPSAQLDALLRGDPSRVQATPPAEMLLEHGEPFSVLEGAFGADGTVLLGLLGVGSRVTTGSTRNVLLADGGFIAPLLPADIVQAALPHLRFSNSPLANTTDKVRAALRGFTLTSWTAVQGTDRLLLPPTLATRGTAVGVKVVPPVFCQPSKSALFATLNSTAQLTCSGGGSGYHYKLVTGPCSISGTPLIQPRVCGETIVHESQLSDVGLTVSVSPSTAWFEAGGRDITWTCIGVGGRTHDCTLSLCRPTSAHTSGVDDRGVVRGGARHPPPPYTTPQTLCWTPPATSRMGPVLCSPWGCRASADGWRMFAARGCTWPPHRPGWSGSS